MPWDSPILTTRQSEIVEEFELRARHGRPPPTYRELCDRFRWASSASARDHLRSLAKKGVLTHAKGKSRGFQLASPKMSSVALLGMVVAGNPEFAMEESATYVNVPANWIGRGVTFALHVHGDSMQNAGIIDGDIVVVRRTGDAAPGDIVAATIDNQTTLKRLTRDKRGRQWLHPENPAYTPIEITSPDTTIHGVVVGLLRDYRPRVPGGVR